MASGATDANAGPVQSNVPPLAGQPVPADFGSAVKGTDPPAGWGKTQLRDCPGGCGIGTAIFGSFTFGPPSGVTSYQWAISDAGPSSTYPTAPGVPGGTPSNPFGDYGWSLVRVLKVGPSAGNFQWTATVSNPLTVILQTVTVDTGAGAPMQHFDPSVSYSWQLLTYQGPYTGPSTDAALTASTIFDLSSGPFANFPLPPTGKFGWHLIDNSTNGGELDLTYSPVPEPGTFAVVAAGLIAVWRRRPIRGQVVPALG